MVSRTTWAGFSIMAAFGGFVVLMLAGESIQDPGGWRSVGLIGSWLVPLIVLCLLGYYRPEIGLPVLAVAALAPVAFGVLLLLDYDRWREFEDSVGPVSLVLSLVVDIGLACAGLHRPWAAGWLMLAVTIVPLMLAVIGAGEDWRRALTIGVALLPMVLSGALFVVAGRRRGTDTAGSPAIGVDRLADRAGGR